MKPFTVIIAIAFYLQVCNAQSGSFDYFGQTPPGNTPEVFAPGTISAGGTKERSIAISPNGDEIFFMRGTGFPNSKIMHMVKSGNTWSSPDTAFFSKDCGATEPAFSPNGQYLYYSTNKGKPVIEDFSLWRIKKEANGWGEPESLFDIGGSAIAEFHPTVTNDSSLYFCYWNYANQTGDIYVSKYLNGKYGDPVIVGDPISTQYSDVDPFIDPNGSYMIFPSSRPGGYGPNDIYISFKKNDGTWTNPKNMGLKVNTQNDDDGVDISPDGKYLFLTKNNDIYWVQAGNLLDSLKKQSMPFDYFGQTPPGNTPEVFAPGTISNTGIRDKDITISPDGKELFFARGTQFPYLKIYHMVKSGDIWSSPDTAVFSKDCRATQPSFSPDGQYIYFSSSRGNADVEYYSLWRTKKNGDGWDEPENIVDTGGKNLMELDPVATKNGVYFLSWDFVNQIGDIGFSKNVAGVQEAPLIIGYPISTQYDEEAPYVDPDETYMIFLSNRPGGYGDDDSYVSYKKNDGTWTNPKNLGPRFNTPNFDNFLDVSPDGKYLFINMNQDIYWVQAGNFIDSLKHTNFIPYVKRTIPNWTAVKDSLFSYQIPDSTFIDDDGNSTLRYSVIMSNGTPLPAWLSFDSVTCVFSGIPDTAVQYNMRVTATDNAGASVSSAAFRITVTDPPAGIKEEYGRVPKGFTLDQNYPNPFNPSTTIRYSLSKPSQVKLTVYNLLGQEIKSLVNSYQSAGEHSLTWDAMDKKNNQVSSGVYFYRLEAENLNIQKKMAFIK